MDPKALTLPRRSITSKREKAPHHKTGEHFLRGPIPMDWLYAASKASGRGRGFQVAIVLWYLSGLNHQTRTVKLSGSVLTKMGIKRHAGYRGLAALEKAGLVHVEKHDGRAPLVTLLGAGRSD